MCWRYHSLPLSQWNVSVGFTTFQDTSHIFSMRETWNVRNPSPTCSASWNSGHFTNKDTIKLLSHTLVGNKIVNHSDVVGGTTSFFTEHLAPVDWAKTKWETFKFGGMVWLILRGLSAYRYPGISRCQTISTQGADNITSYALFLLYGPCMIVPHKWTKICWLATAN